MFFSTSAKFLRKFQAKTLVLVNKNKNLQLGQTQTKTTKTF